MNEHVNNRYVVQVFTGLSKVESRVFYGYDNANWFVKACLKLRPKWVAVTHGDKRALWHRDHDYKIIHTA